MGRKIKVVLDTNIFISALVFGGIPEKVLKLILKKKLEGVTSVILIDEFSRIINEKFPLSSENFYKLEKQVNKQFTIVQPIFRIDVARDEDDNRVLEAAIEGDCQYIITGDKDLLVLKNFQSIEILTPEQFLKIFSA